MVVVDHKNREQVWTPANPKWLVDDYEEQSTPPVRRATEFDLAVSLAPLKLPSPESKNIETQKSNPKPAMTERSLTRGSHRALFLREIRLGL